MVKHERRYNGLSTEELEDVHQEEAADDRAAPRHAPGPSLAGGLRRRGGGGGRADDACPIDAAHTLRPAARTDDAVPIDAAHTWRHAVCADDAGSIDAAHTQRPAARADDAWWWMVAAVARDARLRLSSAGHAAADGMPGPAHAVFTERLRTAPVRGLHDGWPARQWGCAPPVRALRCSGVTRRNM